MDQQPHSESQGGQFWCQFKWPNTILSPIKLSLISYHTVYAVYFNTKCSSLTNFYSLKILLLLSWEIDIPDIPFIFLILLSLHCKDCKEKIWPVHVIKHHYIIPTPPKHVQHNWNAIQGLSYCLISAYIKRVNNDIFFKVPWERLSALKNLNNFKEINFLS